MCEAECDFLHEHDEEFREARGDDLRRDPELVQGIEAEDRWFGAPEIQGEVDPRMLLGYSQESGLQQPGIHTIPLVDAHASRPDRDPHEREAPDNHPIYPFQPLEGRRREGWGNPLEVVADVLPLSAVEGADRLGMSVEKV